jgi:hypothetical protein
MERELVSLLGAGLTAVATGFGVPVAVGAIDSGYTLVDVLSRESGPRIGATLNGMVQNLWLAWQQTGMSRETIAQHAGALPAILELNRPPWEVFAAARQHADGGRMLAAQIIERARHTGDVARANLDEGAAYQLLEQLFQVILADPAPLQELMTAVDLYLKTDLWRHDPAQAQTHTQTQTAPLPPPAVVPPPLAPIEAADLAQLAPAAVAAIRTAVEAHGQSIADQEATVAELSRSLSGLVERIVTLARSAPEIATFLNTAARQIHSGALTDADMSLTAAQEILIHRASVDLSAARRMMHWAAEVLASRAGLERARLDFRKAARHYRAATRCFTRADAELQLHFVSQQGLALQQLDKLKRDDAALVEAARALAEVCALPPGPVDRAEWARAHLRLSGIHIELGRRTGSTQEFLVAAQVAGLAVATYTEMQVPEEAAEAQFMQAQAFWLAGDGPGDLAALDAAAHAYGGALRLYSQETSPGRWVAASSMMGQVLLRMATLRAEPGLLPSAIEHLRGAAQFASTCKVPIDAVTTETALGRALLAEYAAGGQALLLDLAATAFRRAIKGAHAEKTLARKAALQHELGMTLWAMAERANDSIAIVAAEETLEASVATFKSVDEAGKASAVEADLNRLRESLPGKAAFITGAIGSQYS